MKVYSGRLMVIRFRLSISGLWLMLMKVNIMNSMLSMVVGSIVLCIVLWCYSMISVSE